jgi:hypothetical protein
MALFHSRRYTAVCAVAIAGALGSLAAAPRQTLRNHVPQAVGESQRFGSLSPMARLELAIGLPLRDPDGLDQFLAEVSDPQSPNYRQFLTASEFADSFGPAQEDYDKLIQFIQSHGLTVSATHPNRMILDVVGPVSAIEAAFHVNIGVFEHATRGRFFAPDRDPSIDLDVPVLDITGLDNFSQPQPMNLKTTPMSSVAPYVSGSGPAGLFIGKDFRAAYAPGVTLTGTGQTIGLFELDGFYASDVQANFKQAGLPAVAVQTVLLDGFSGAPGSSNIEVTLDIMMAAYMAPGANIVVYEGRNPNDVLNRMATDNVAKQLSCSWGFSPISATTEQIFKQMVAQGQSLFQASGDNGAYHGPIMPPSDDPNVTSVGGTALTTTGPGGQWQSEAAWSGSGGGVSTTYPIPSYQQGVNMTAVGGSKTMRNIPDVALTGAVQMFLIQNNGTAVAVGGTSAAAPLWAGFIALANQQALANGKPAVGFLNPVLYGLGTGSKYTSDFHDITAGNTGFAALPGYDLATGWGTPTGQSLINDLTAMANPPSFTLSATPAAVTVLAGSTAPSVIQVNAQNGFSGSAALTVSGLPAGVTATFSAASTSTSSTLTFVAAATAAAGVSNVTVTGKSGSLSATVTIPLTVVHSPFTLTATPSSVTVAPGSAATSNIAVAPISGFTGKVTLSASGLPSGVTASFNPATATTGSTVTFSAASNAAAGTSNITVTGVSGSSSATVTVSLTVKPAAGFTLSVSPASLSIAQGTSGSTILSAAVQNGFSGTINITVSGVPSGVSLSFSAGGPGSLKLTFTAGTSAAVGPATVTIAGTSGSLSASTTLALTVVAPPSFKLAATVSNVSVAAGATGSTALSVVPQGGFSGPVVLGVTGLPAGVTASFSPATMTTASTLTLSAASSAAVKATQITVTGTCGTLTSSQTITVAVTPRKT